MKNPFVFGRLKEDDPGREEFETAIESILVDAEIVLTNVKDMFDKA
ncbi:hypothetical protein [Shouchella patagoniensis]|nr:hypothetical protein [Shouchella patagoniensis]